MAAANLFSSDGISRRRFVGGAVGAGLSAASAGPLPAMTAHPEPTDKHETIVLVRAGTTPDQYRTSDVVEPH